MKKHRQFITTFTLLALLLVSNLYVTPARAATDDTPAVGVLTLDLAASESVTVRATDVNYTFMLSGATWTGTDSADVTGNGTNTLTIKANAFTDINITDSGTGTSVTFGNSGANSFQDNFTVVLNDGSGTVTVTNGTNFLAGNSLAITADAITVNAAVATADGSILFSADAMSIAAEVNAGTDIVTLQPLTAGQLIDLGGADAAGTLGLTDTEIDFITAGILRIGSSSAGTISFTSLISPAGTDTLSLITGDEITDGNGGADVQVANLAIQAVNGITDSGSTLLDTRIDTLAARNTTSGTIAVLELSNGGDLTIGTVDGIVGVRNTANSGPTPTLGIQIETNNGNLTVNADIFNQRRNIFLVAQQGNGGSGDSLFTNNADISTAANNGQIRIDANNMALEGGTISGPNRVILEDDPGSDVTIAINLGGGDGTNTLGLTDAELDTVSTNGTLQIGHTNGGGTGDIAVTAPIDLTDGPSIPTTELISGAAAAAIDGSGGFVLTANTLNLTAGTTIGSNGDPFEVNATELTTAGNGDQVLSETDSVTIGDDGLDADTGNTIQLAGGTFLTTSSGGDIQNETSVLNGATLGGTGTVNGAVTAQSGGAVAPGVSPGILSTGDVNLTDGANFNLEVNGTTTAGTDYDQLNVTGSVTINSSANLVTSGTVAGTTAGDTLVIINNDGVDAVSGTFDGLPDGANVTINGQAFNIFYNGGDGNDVVLVETTAPSLTSFTRQTPTTSPTNADSLVFRVTFNEDVENVDVTDFAVDGATTATVTDVSAVSASIYDVTISGGDLADFDGVVGLDLDGSQDIQDLVGNALPTGEPGTDETYTLEHTAPSLTAFTRQTPASSPTNADSLVFRVTFSEDVENVDAADFAIDGATTATVTDVSAVSASIYDVTISGGDLADFDGVVGLDLDGSQDIQDLAGNALPAGEPATDETYTVDNSAPEISGITLLSPTGTISDTQPTFSWTAATDTGSGVVSYTLQLTLDSDVQEDSVIGTGYTPTTDLVAGDYTWTVKAYDAVGNVSEFVSPVASFTLEASSSSSDYQLFLPIVIKD